MRKDEGRGEMPRGSFDVGPDEISAKSFISTHIARDRCKSFISNTSQNRVGVGGTSFFENGLWEVRVGDG